MREKLRERGREEKSERVNKWEWDRRQGKDRKNVTSFFFTNFPESVNEKEL